MLGLCPIDSFSGQRVNDIQPFPYIAADNIRRYPMKMHPTTASWIAERDDESKVGIEFTASTNNIGVTVFSLILRRHRSSKSRCSSSNRARDCRDNADGGSEGWWLLHSINCSLIGYISCNKSKVRTFHVAKVKWVLFVSVHHRMFCLQFTFGEKVNCIRINMYLRTSTVFSATYSFPAVSLFQHDSCHD